MSISHYPIGHLQLINIWLNKIMEYRKPSNSFQNRIGNLIELFEIRKWQYYSNTALEQFNHVNEEILGNIRKQKYTWGNLIYDSCNLGDEIQSLAAIGLIPSPKGIIPIHREYLNQNQLSGLNSLTIPVLLNGWFTHLPKNWPPHNSLQPIFIGFHISNPELADFKHREYYNSLGPIGCRDTTTVNYLEKIGVEAFFSGCPTITLKKPDVERGDSVFIVDAHLKSAAGHIPDTTNLLRSLVPNSILDKATYITHNVKPYQYRWHGYKMKRAIEILKLYAGAKLVITSRLHCALPCLAFGTPCVFLHQNLHSDTRLADYRSILNGYSSPTDKININWENPEPQDVTDFQQLIYSSTAQQLKRLP